MLKAQLQQQKEKHSGEYEDIRRMHREIAEEQTEQSKYIDGIMRTVANARRSGKDTTQAIEEYNQESEEKDDSVINHHQKSMKL